jgi:TPR repeat protein/autonomous glycyl radical cofactor GrcA
VDKTARIWDAHTGAAIAVFSGHTKSVGTAVFSPDGTRVLTASDDKSIRIWDARSGEPLIVAATPDAVQSAAYSPDGRHIVASYADGTFGIRDAASGVPTSAFKKIHRDYIASTEYSPDGMRIVTASIDKTVRVWDAQSLNQLLVIPHKDFVYDAVYSPDGQLILTAAVDSLAHIFNAQTGEELRVLTGHHHFLGPAAFSADGRRIVTGSFDQTVRIWDTQTGIQLADLLGHHGMVNGVCFSPDGKHVASASADNTARIWDATIPADWHSQLLWEQTAEADPLAEVGGTLLGVSSTMALLVKGAVVAEVSKDARPDTLEHTSRCAQQVGAYYDPDRTGTGVDQAAIDPDLAAASCARLQTTARGSAQISYLAGRALLANGDVVGARREFESAVAGGYRAASVDLALLLSDPDAHMVDARRAASLLRQAWDSGVPIAGFELGTLYERGVAARVHRASVGWWQVEPLSLSDNGNAGGKASEWQTNNAEAWRWYQEAARRAEPHALARLAERAEREAISGLKPDNELLAAFTLYARAAEGARKLAWPENVWRSWRYRRATLAHLLARAGLIAQVASAYEAILTQQTGLDGVRNSGVSN